MNNMRIITSNYQIFGNSLTQSSVSVLTQPNNHVKAYINSEDGRAELLAEIDDADIIAQIMAVWGDSPTAIPESPPDISFGEQQNILLHQNSNLCHEILVNDFQSDIKGTLQPYRFNKDDQMNLAGYNIMILQLLLQDSTGASLPLFSWRNANQLVCDDDWHFSEILGLLRQFEEWKTRILKRQDKIKAEILNAKNISQLNKIDIDYSDLLNFTKVTNRTRRVNK